MGRTRMRPAGTLTREAQVVQLLTERREKLTISEIARELMAERENVRSVVKRLWAKGRLEREMQPRLYKVGNSVCKHRAALWFMPP